MRLARLWTARYQMWAARLEGSPFDLPPSSCSFGNALDANRYWRPTPAWERHAAASFPSDGDLAWAALGAGGRTSCRDPAFSLIPPSSDRRGAQDGAVAHDSALEDLSATSGSRPRIPRRRRMSDFTCPVCGGTSIPIVYGDPTPEVIGRLEAGEVAWGGSISGSKLPDCRCQSCGKRFCSDRETQRAHNAETDLQLSASRHSGGVTASSSTRERSRQTRSPRRS